MIDGEKELLESLYTINGEKIKWHRQGSVNVNGVNGVIDIYDTYLPSGKLYKTIYINMYGAKKSTKAPEGFVIKETTNQIQLLPQKRRKIKTKFCSHCGSIIDGKTKICTGCGKKYFKIRLNKFSVAIIVLSVVIASLTALNVVQYLNTQNLQKEIVDLEKQVSTKETSLKYVRELNDELKKENSENLAEHNFFRNHAVIIGNDNTNKYHKYGCSLLDTSDGFWIYNSKAAEGDGYKACSYCN